MPQVSGYSETAAEGDESHLTNSLIWLDCKFDEGHLKVSLSY